MFEGSTIVDFRIGVCCCGCGDGDDGSSCLGIKGNDVEGRGEGKDGNSSVSICTEGRVGTEGPGESSTSAISSSSVKVRWIIIFGRD